MEASTHHHHEVETRSGWFTFAGFMFIIAGAANLMWGFAALDSKQYLSEAGLLFSTLTFWGWISIIWGVAALVCSWALLTRSSMAVAMGVSMATLSAIFWLFALPVLPIWSLVIIAIDVLIVYGLVSSSESEEH
ncbi:MAG: hypothetical protein WCJ63_03140 [Actinomycetes bacterium]